MLKCPYDDYTCGLKQQLSLHLQGVHKDKWNGTVDQSIPAGFDIGTVDPEIKKAYEIKRLKGSGKKLNYYALLTPEEKAARYERERVRKRQRRLEAARLSGQSKWECPYCDFATLSPTHKTRHLNRDHPNETGMVEFREHALKVAKKIDRMVPVPESLAERRRRELAEPETPYHDRIIAAVVMAVADRIYNDIKGGMTNNEEAT